MENIKREKYPRFNSGRKIPDWMGYPGSDYSRYDPQREELGMSDRRNTLVLEGAGRKGWDQDQNTAYAGVYGNRRGLSNYDTKTDKGQKGKGPRNYRRSDERIMEDLYERLSYDQIIDASEIEIKVEQGEVFLSGKVAERSFRHRAEDLACSVPGVGHVENNIRIATR